MFVTEWARCLEDPKIKRSLACRLEDIVTSAPPHRLGDRPSMKGTISRSGLGVDALDGTR